MPTQLEYNLTKQNFRVIRIKINLLNSKFQVVGELTGNVVENPSFSIDSNSDIRRTCDISIAITDSSFDISQGNKIWIDKYIQVYVGLKNVLTDEIEYTNMGIYLINNPQTTYNIDGNILKFQGIDLMSKLTGLRNGNLEGIPYFIQQGSNVRVAIIAVLSICGFEKYVVEECPYDVPNDINIDIGGTAYDILKSLLDIVPNYQMYFDVDGVFHYNKIPSGANEQIMVDDDIWKATLIEYTKDTDFESLKNSIEVFGKTHDIKYFGGTADTSNNKYSITITGLETLYNNMLIGFVTDKNVSKTLNINGENEYKILNENGTEPTFSTNEKYYVVRYVEKDDIWEFDKVDLTVENPPLATIIEDTFVVLNPNIVEYKDGYKCTFRTPQTGCDLIYNPKFRINSLNDVSINNSVRLRNDTVYTIVYNKFSDKSNSKYFQFMGEITPYAKIQETNPLSPFYVNGEAGEIRIVLSGGDYDNIYTSELALERAKWELYTRCRLQDNVNVTCLPIYWLDVNWLVSITLPNINGIEETEQYIVKSITIGDAQSITMQKYYSYYDEQ